MGSLGPLGAGLDPIGPLFVRPCAPLVSLGAPWEGLDGPRSDIFVVSGVLEVAQRDP